MARLAIPCILIMIGILSCQNVGLETAQQIVSEVQKQYAPDKRVAIFDVSCQAGHPIKVTGETNISKAKSALVERMAQAGIEVEDAIVLLPEGIDNQTHALVNVSVANFRSHPRHSAELVTQALLGAPLHLLKQENGWYLAQTPDQYIAWIQQSGLWKMDSAEFAKWRCADKLIFLPNYGHSVNESGQQVSDLAFGNVLEIRGESQKTWEIAYPDGRPGMIEKGHGKPLTDWLAQRKLSDSSAIRAATALMGVPYLWGGTSTKGMDCSGFTKTVYLSMGLVLPRDASQQVLVGKLVDDKKEIKNLQVGDLLFFGKAEEDGTERVVHVGMWIGNNRFIHASGDVHISSLDSLSTDFDQYNYDRYLRAKRFFGHHEAGLPATLQDIYSNPIQ
jgi:cell wall-associated NlpC family hydrolase